MDCMYIKGGRKMSGSLAIGSAKNSLLPILAGSIMCNGYVELVNCVKYIDVEIMIEILRDMGCIIIEDSDRVIIDPRSVTKSYIKEEFSRKVRSSIVMLGAMLSRFRKARVAYPEVAT